MQSGEPLELRQRNGKWELFDRTGDLVERMARAFSIPPKTLRLSQRNEPHELTELDDLQDQVLRGIGRNVLNLQQMEGMLKFIFASYEPQLIYGSRTGSSRSARCRYALHPGARGFASPYFERKSDTGQVYAGQDDKRCEWNRSVSVVAQCRSNG